MTIHRILTETPEPVQAPPINTGPVTESLGQDDQRVQAHRLGRSMNSTPASRAASGASGEAVLGLTNLAQMFQTLGPSIGVSEEAMASFSAVLGEVALPLALAVGAAKLAGAGLDALKGAFVDVDRRAVKDYAAVASVAGAATSEGRRRRLWPVRWQRRRLPTAGMI